MRTVSVAAVACLLCGVMGNASATEVRHPPAEIFGQLPSLTAPQISPDGKHLATTKTYQGTPLALIYDLEKSLADQVPVAVPLNDDGFIESVRWASNDRLLMVININTVMHNAKVRDTKVRAWFRTISIDVTGHTPVELLRNSESKDYNPSASTIDDLALDDPEYIYMPLWSEDTYFHKLVLALYKVSVKTGNASLLLRGSDDTVDFIMDGHGKLLARIDQENYPLTDHILRYDDGDWKKLSSYEAEGILGAAIVGASEDGKNLVQSVIDNATGIQGLVTLSLADASLSRLFMDGKYDIDEVLTDPWTNRVIGVKIIDDMAHDRYFDPEMQKLQRGLEQAFPGNAVQAVSWDMSRQKIIVAVDGAKMPRVYYYLDRTKHAATPLGLSYQGLVMSDLGDVKPYPYKARDGLDIPAYLTLPPGKTPKNLPVVIMPHGGPMARDSMSFDWMAQFLANRGYAVLQPNFRGSSGYGEKFEKAGYGQWGLKMQDDVADGVKKLIADGIADPKRICIVGSSYGGYTALAGAAFTPDLYACAASWAGVADLRQFLSTRSEDYGADSKMISAWSLFIGDRREDTDKLDAVSPARHADAIKCPILLMHGKDDSTVRIQQSEFMERALRKAGKQVTFIPIKGESHYMQRAETRTNWLQELEKFLKNAIGN